MIHVWTDVSLMEIEINSNSIGKPFHSHLFSDIMSHLTLRTDWYCCGDRLVHSHWFWPLDLLAHYSLCFTTLFAPSNVATPVFWPDDWTAATSDGRRTAQFEHTLLMTDEGAVPLTGKIETSPKQFWEK
ncbi:unnamed protein product [Choristocarpus tenellus]